MHNITPHCRKFTLQSDCTMKDLEVVN